MQTISKKLSIKAHARLHFGFFDLCGSPGRKFGSLGLALAQPVTEIEASIADTFSIVGNTDAKSSENITNSVQLLQKTLNLPASLTLNIKQRIPCHAGLGSGTQLALSLVALFNQLYDLNISETQMAQLSGRGARSGIGLGAFERGGFLVDSGKNLNDLPEIAIRYDFPQNWRIILVSDNVHVGVHGESELQAFQTLKPMQSSLKEMVFSQMVPALQRADLLAFGAYMSDLQAYNGTYFSPIQGGHFASKNVESALTFLQENGAVCLGQSSWGPTGFAIVENEVKANLHLAQLKKQFAYVENLSFVMTQGYNQGATLLNKSIPCKSIPSNST